MANKHKLLDPNQIVAVRETKTPLNRSRTGWGSKLPTSLQVKLTDNIWRRVYSIQWSNVSYSYVRVAGENLYLAGTAFRRVYLSDANQGR